MALLGPLPLAAQSAGQVPDDALGYSPADPRGLVLGQDGALYGTSMGGGAFDYGTVFKINRDGSDFTNVDEFHGRTRKMVQ